ncbi:MAG: methyl-accepting chemotaxis protein [Janthinobacterium lividum]
MSLSIKGRVGLTSGLLAAALVAVGSIGLYGLNQSNVALQNTFNNQMPAVREIGDVALFTTRERLTARNTIDRIGTDLAEPTIVKALDLRTKADAAWQSYMSLPKSPESKALADATQTTRLAVQQILDQIYAAMRAQDRARAVQLTDVTLQPAFEAVISADGKLQDYLRTKAEKGYQNAMSTFDMVSVFSILALLSGIVLALYSWISLRRSIGVPLQAALGHFDAIAAGDLRTRIVVYKDDEMGELMRGLEKMQASLIDTVTSVRSGGESIATASQQIAAGNNDLAARTEEQAASLQQTAASMAELTGTVKQNADNARQASGLADAAHDVARQGSEIVSQVVATMAGIDESSSKIADIIGIIEGIAFQTNILALNAAVEAARAGEEGRGFAVVANEVRTLAQRSSAAAKEIKGLIDLSGERVRTGTDLTARAGETMTRISTSIQRVTDIMGEIASASNEQSRGIEQVNQAVTQMDGVTQQNAALVEEAAAAAGSLQTQAEKLREVVAVFQMERHRAVQPTAPLDAHRGRFAPHAFA